MYYFINGSGKYNIILNEKEVLNMNLTWNLNDLFESNEVFYDEIEKIKKALSNINKYRDIEVDEKSFLDMLDEKWKIKELANNVLVYGSLMYYKNIKSEECIKLTLIK